MTEVSYSTTSGSNGYYAGRFPKKTRSFVVGFASGIFTYSLFLFAPFHLLRGHGIANCRTKKLSYFCFFSCRRIRTVIEEVASTPHRIRCQLRQLEVRSIWKSTRVYVYTHPVTQTRFRRNLEITQLSG
jgi:hypothetical protein